ncbi:hypothetical protein [Botrimarina sp.]|uniref:hypothetical protein n=1 Tax=Botrimarina sp. TaxID=2795802 RepID=UPI0032EDE7AC
MNDPDPGEMRDHYDFGPDAKPVRGKYAAAYRRGTNFVLIDPDLMAHFGTPEAINEALRKAATETAPTEASG